MGKESCLLDSVAVLQLPGAGVRRFFVFADSSWVNCKDIYEKFLKRVRKQSERKEQRKQNERKE